MASPTGDELTRRTFLTHGLAATGMAVASPLAARPQPAPARAIGSFPKGFLWGAATAAHQVEGNNINSDGWVLEHMTPSMFPENLLALHEPALVRGAWWLGASRCC